VSSGMGVHIPAEIACGGLVDRGRHGRKISGDVMFEAVFADVMEQLLEAGNFDDASSAKSLQGIVGKAAAAGITADFALDVVGGETGEAHGPGLHYAHAGSEGIFLAHGTGDDGLVVHFHVAEEVLWKIAAVETDGLVGVGAVVVVPVEQSAGRFRSELESMHAENAADVHFAGAREKRVAHHAHDGAGYDAEILFERGPALDGTDLEVGSFHPVIDDRAKLGHFQQRGLGDICGGDVFLDGLQFLPSGFVVILHTTDAAEDFGEVEGFDGDATGFEQFFAVAHGVEGCRTGAEGTDAEIAQAVHNAADGGKPCKVLGELRGIGGFGVQRGQGVRNAVLPEIVTGGHFAAKAIAAMRDGHFAGRIRRGLDENGDTEASEAKRVCNGALVPEVGESDDDTVDDASLGAKEFGTAFGFFVSFHGAMFALFRLQSDEVVTGFLQRLYHFLPARLGQVIREKSPVAYDEAHSHLLLAWHDKLRDFPCS